MTHLKRRLIPTHAGLILLALLSDVNRTEAQQDVFSPPPPPPVQAVQPLGVRVFPDPPLSGIPPPESPFEWGALVLKPHFLYRFLYGDGIPATPGHSSTTAINSFSPGVLADIGSHWSIDYSPMWELYSNRIFHDTLDEYASVLGAYNFGTWSFQLNQSYAYSSEPLIETGRQTTQETYSTGLDVTDRLTRQILSETVLHQDFRDGIGLPNTKEWSALEWLHYQFSSQLDAAVGGDFGFVDVLGGTETSYIQPQVQLIANPTDKISISASGGVDHREFLVQPRTSLDTPMFSGSVQYAPFESTTLSLSTSRVVAQSFFVNQSTKNTQWRAVLKQRFLGHYLLTATASQFDSDYISNETGKSSGRSDRDLSYNVKVSWRFFRRGTMSVLYQWGRNTSNIQAFGFETHQVGFEIGYKY